MNCSNCDAALSVGSETHLLNCAFCGAVQRNPDSTERRPIDAILDQVFAETGDPAFEVRGATPVEPAAMPAAVGELGELGELGASGGVAAEPAAPEAREARRETHRALDDIFGDEAAAEIPSAAATAVAAEPTIAPELTPVAPAAPLGFEPEMPRQRLGGPPKVILGGDPQEYPEWTKHLVPFLVLALLAGAGVAAIAAAVLN